MDRSGAPTQAPTLGTDNTMTTAPTAPMMTAPTDSTMTTSPTPPTMMTAPETMTTAPVTGGTGAMGGQQTAGTTASGAGGTMAMGGAGGTGAQTADPMVMQCLERGMMMGEDPACSECVCTMCLEEATEVYDNADATFSTNAQGVISCVREQCCEGTDCYCGEGANDNPLLCIAPGPMGPCKTQIEAAAGVMDDAIMVQAACDPAMGTTACAAAQRFGACVLGDSMTAGNCPACDTCM